MNSEGAYWKAKADGWSIELEEIVCKKPIWAFYFARNVERADIEKCQEAACREAYWAYSFGRNVKGANIEKCQEGACKEAEWAYYFASYVKGANIERIRELCPEISDKLDELVMDRVLK